MGQAIVQPTTVKSPVTAVRPTFMAYPVILVDLSTLVSSKTSVTMPSAAIPPTPPTPHATLRPTITAEPTTPHPFPWLLPMTLFPPTIPMVRTTLMMSPTLVAEDIMGAPTTIGSPTTMVGFTTTVRLPTRVGSIHKAWLSGLFAAGRAQRTHRRLHAVDLFYWLWEKLSYFIWDIRRMLRRLTESLAFEGFILFIVCLNTVMLVAQTFAQVEIRGEWHFMALDSIFLCIYVVEAVLKIVALGLKYFYDPWNKLDFFIMVLAVLDFMLMHLNSPSFTHAVYNQNTFRIVKVLKSLRTLRAIWVLRRLRSAGPQLPTLVSSGCQAQIPTSTDSASFSTSAHSFLTSLQEVTGTLARSLPSITAILILMFTCLCIHATQFGPEQPVLFSVVFRALFRQSDPKRFQSIFTTIFTLFTLLTLDDWSLIYMDSRAQGAWYIIPILMIYIIIQYFIFLNLVIAVLVDNFQMALLKGLEKVKQEEATQVHENLLDDSLRELIEAEPEEALSEHTRQKQLVEKQFGTMTEKQQELLFHFLQLAAGVEHYQQKFRSQAAVIDEIVDTAFEAGEEDFRR
ncbi:Cation channel sperm-associated protein 1 [Camelus dromedarius]|uniref:Cation channel sperm-associated protein 1 n=1 Tax=Camelus dromedarius TaxID=9838 RepID=A0A5N4BYP3_CAMDR|nr:Cation channel sperm-associated protein 1 [Camelus dromedarius]